MKVFLVAGETSGDHHGAALVEVLRELPADPGAGAGHSAWNIAGLGGPRLAEISPRRGDEGEGIEDWLDQAAVLGLWEVLRKYPYFSRKMRETVERIGAWRPDAVLFVDYPGFNLRLAKRLREGGYGGKLIYYISPQVWAWKKGRVQTMAELLDLMVCIFPFEKPLYENSGLRTVFAGHPLVEKTLGTPTSPSASADGKALGAPSPSLASPTTAPAGAGEISAGWSEAEPRGEQDGVGVLGGEKEKEKEKEKESLGEEDRDPNLVALLPGSREREIDAHFPAMLGAAELLLAENPRLRFATTGANLALTDRLRQIVNEAGLSERFHIGQDRGRAIMREASVGVVASGTATLEAAFLALPYCLVYKVNWLTAWVARRVMSVPFLGIVNVIADREVVSELLQRDATAENIAAELRRLLENPEVREQLRAELGEVVRSLGEGGAHARAAEAVAEEVVGSPEKNETDAQAR